MRGPAEACAGADVVCATTHPGADPVVRRELLDPGAHVVSVGWDRAGREVDDATVRDALVVVESRTAAAGSPDLSAATVGELPELGELVAGTRPGRTSGEQLTLYKSVGVAVQDATAATLVLAAARERGVGREVEL
ncbi:hypothetical protein ACI797_04705 [Geodermatophilus sp. SYSU D00691]